MDKFENVDLNSSNCKKTVLINDNSTLNSTVITSDNNSTNEKMTRKHFFIS